MLVSSLENDKKSLKLLKFSRPLMMMMILVLKPQKRLIQVEVGKGFVRREKEVCLCLHQWETSAMYVCRSEQLFIRSFFNYTKQQKSMRHESVLYGTKSWPIQTSKGKIQTLLRYGSGEGFSAYHGLLEEQSNLYLRSSVSQLDSPQHAAREF